MGVLAELPLALVLADGDAEPRALLDGDKVTAEEELADAQSDAVAHDDAVGVKVGVGEVDAVADAQGDGECAALSDRHADAEAHALAHAVDDGDTSAESVAVSETVADSVVQPEAEGDSAALNVGASGEALADPEAYVDTVGDVDVDAVATAVDDTAALGVALLQAEARNVDDIVADAVAEENADVDEHGV